MTEALTFHWETQVGGQAQVGSRLLDHASFTVGRADANEGRPHISIPGDNLISRLHFQLSSEAGQLQVLRLPSGRNPLFYRGNETDTFQLANNESFVVGQTRFWSTSPAPLATPDPTEFTLMGPARTQVREESSYECFRAIMEMLPALRSCSEEGQIWRKALEVLRRLLPEATGLLVLREGSVVACDPPQASSLRPSSRLIARAEAQRATVSFSWDQTSSNEATVLDQVSWAVASPADGYMLYAMGEIQGQDLFGRVALIDVVTETVAHHVALGEVHRIQAQVGQFFSPVLREMMAKKGFQDALQPRRTSVTVMFFDLRGFSKATEAAEEDNLVEILRYHSLLMEVMTQVTECVFQRNGVVIDYQGDAVLACWGTPVERPDHAQAAIEAAREILERIYALNLPFAASQTGRDLRCGIGLGSGEVIAGQVGARDLAKFGVMGRVVNHASRLEGLTKQLGVPILVNKTLYEQLPPDGAARCRCLGRIRPAGVTEASNVYEVVVSRQQGGSGLSAAEVDHYHAAYEHYRQGQFLECLQRLRDLPVDDPIGIFLARQALARQAEGVGTDWQGVLEFRSK